MEAFIHGIPKAELHIHIEGALGPELMLELAVQNGIDLPYSSVDDMRRAYDFKNLQGLTSEDIYKLARNAFRASFLNPAEKQKYLNELNDFVSSIFS